MASDNKRRRYTCQQALDFIVNDSDSEGPYVESDSEMTDLSNDARNSPSERSSVTVTPAISESSDSDDEMPRPIRRPRQQRAVGVRGRGWGRGRGGRGVNNAQGERPAIVNGVGVGDIPLAAETVLVNGRNLNWDTYDGVDPYDSEWLPDFTGRQGVLVDTTDFDPLKYFQLFFPEEAFVLICNETNKYATQFFDNTADFPPSSRFHKWEETDIQEMKADGGHRIVEKPVLAEKYNQHMGGVDILDQKLGSYSYPHKSSKWYTTIFHRLREVALVNGYIVYCKDAGEDAVPPKVFREHVVSGLLEGYMKKASRRGRPSTDVPTRLTERHFAGKYEDPKYKPDCVVCSSRTKEGWKRKQTNYMCKQCNLPMCFIPCHEIYHTNKNFQQEAARVVYNL